MFTPAGRLRTRARTLAHKETHELHAHAHTRTRRDTRTAHARTHANCVSRLKEKIRYRERERRHTHRRSMDSTLPRRGGREIPTQTRSGVGRSHASHFFTHAIGELPPLHARVPSINAATRLGDAHPPLPASHTRTPQRTLLTMQIYPNHATIYPSGSADQHSNGLLAHRPPCHVGCRLPN